MPHPTGPAGDAERHRIGATVRALRLARALTVTDLAHVAGFTHPAQLSNVEAGRKGLTPARAVQVARALDVDPELLLSREVAAAVHLARTIGAPTVITDVTDATEATELTEMAEVAS